MIKWNFNNPHGETGALLKWREERSSRTGESNYRRGTSCTEGETAAGSTRLEMSCSLGPNLDPHAQSTCAVFKPVFYQVVHLIEADLKRWSGGVWLEEWQAHLTDRYRCWCPVPLQVVALIRTSVMWLKFNGLSPQKAVRWSLLIPWLKWVLTV